jgi:transcriptional regulator with XRE-family HTH domain
VAVERPWLDPISKGSDVPPRSARPSEFGDLGSHLSRARLERGLSQAELAERCALSQTQISYFELGQRRPTLDQFVRIARALDYSIEGLMAGANRPGNELRHMAVELRSLGMVDLWVKDVVVPGAFRLAEELIAMAVAGEGPDPRIVEAIPAVLAWNEIDPILLRAHGLATRPRTTRRLAWLADIALAIDRRGGLPGGCRKRPLERFTRMIPVAAAGPDDWDSLGRPMAKLPTSPIWKRWRINYDADIARFEKRARDLDELRRRPGDRRTSRIPRKGSIAGGSSLEEPRERKQRSSR